MLVGMVCIFRQKDLPDKLSLFRLLTQQKRTGLLRQAGSRTLGLKDLLLLSKVLVFVIVHLNS